MFKKRIWKNLLLIIVFSLFLGLVDNPWKLPELETDIPVITPVWNWMQASEISLGLDLQGGTQLDYQIDLTDARERNADDIDDNDVDVAALIDGVKDVIERRVNSLGVAEPNIYLSSAGDEQHIVVELPGVEDLDEAKNRVGEVVQLEFKTEKEEASEEDIAAISEEAAAYLEMVTAEENIENLEEFLGDDAVPNRIEYRLQEESYINELPVEFQGVIPDMEENTFHQEVLQAKESEYVFDQGQYYQPEGLNILRVTEKSTELRKSPINAEDFATIMTELGQEVDTEYYREDNIIPENLAVEISVLEIGEITGLVETDDGYYISKMDKKLEMDTGDNPEPMIRTAHILLKTENPIPIKEEKELKEVPENASDRIRDKIKDENINIEEENRTIRSENAEAEANNEKIAERNAEVLKKAEGILAQVKDNPESFADLAKENSEDSSAENGGDLGYSRPSAYVQEYGSAALAMEPGEITQELVKSQFGYHIIKLIDNKEADEERYQFSTIRICYAGTNDCESELTQEEAQVQAEELLRRVREEAIYTVERVWFNATPDPWEKTELDGRYFKRADVAYDQISFRPYVAITFDDEGAVLFEELTEANINKRIGIFVGGEFISAPNVQEKISGGNAQITLGESNVQIALQEANELARSLNAGSIPAPLKKPDEMNIGATLGQEALQASIYAGIFGLLMVALFMIAYYRFLGVLATCSLGVYGLFLTFVIQSEIPAVISISLTFIMWIAFAMGLFKSKIDGFAKAIFLIFSVVGVLFVFSVLVNPIVLTLAGVSGLILSIGMAVDANILIFERIKEEFADGKSFLVSVTDGFERAWSSILDSNMSTLITCAILFYFGTSIIKGFAINLAAGVVISMFTAITVTKTFLLLFEGTSLEKINWLWKKKNRQEHSNLE